jgi:hypothetical protein
MDNIKIHFTNEYTSIRSSVNNSVQFLEVVEKIDYDNEDASYYTKKTDLEDTYSTVSQTFTVKGVIQNVEKYTLRTDSLIADCVLGQGAALDCFNAKLQDAISQKAYNENALLQEAINVLQTLTDPMLKVELLKSLLGKNNNTDEGGQV